jgi:hypothetical protein
MYPAEKGQNKKAILMNYNITWDADWIIRVSFTVTQWKAGLIESPSKDLWEKNDVFKSKSSMYVVD